MPIDYYAGQSIEQLEGLLQAAQQRKAKGNITQVAAAGVNTVRDFSRNRFVEQEIMDILFSLYLRAKDSGDENLVAKYPDPRRSRITRTRISYV